jgi:cytochrome b pre-mRNA-processing protein 3
LFGRWFRRPESDGIASTLYGAIVAQARDPALYDALGVADTLDGRFEMVVLHCVLVTERLKGEGEEARALGQAVFDVFCTDMDRSLREIGVGDLSVPKRMKEMSQRFYGRAAAYGSALAAGDRAGLAAALARNVTAGDAGRAAQLAGYVMAAHGSLAATPPDVLMRGAVTFADPTAVARVQA